MRPTTAGDARAGALTVALGILGVIALIAFVAIKGRARQPMLPLALFGSTQFTGANLTTLAVYAGLGGALFLVVLQLQLTLHYSATQAGLSLLLMTLLMFAFSSRVGALAQRIGPRVPMTAGPIVAAVGLVLFGRVQPGSPYLTTVLWMKRRPALRRSGGHPISFLGRERAPKLREPLA